MKYKVFQPLAPPTSWEVIKCLWLLVCCFVCFVWGEGCGRVVLISFKLLIYLAVIFMSLARYKEQSEILATFLK